MERLIRLWYPVPRGARPGAGPRRPPRAARWPLALLQPLAYLYGAAMHARRRAYERGWLRVHAAGRPVIVVGNLTVGGTGKTPLILWLASRLAARGVSVGIVSRGYGRRSGGLRRVLPNAHWEDVGDEPLLIHRRSGCAVIVAEDRVTAARRLAAEGVDVVLSDDGLQHLRLARDCEIVVVDGVRGFGNGRLLPAGPLREPAARALGADYVIVNGSAAGAEGDRGAEGDAGVEGDAGGPIAADAALRGRRGPVARMRLVLGEAHRVDGQGPPRPLASFRGAPVHAVAGIGHPARFFRDLAARGLRVIEHAYPDHHPFARGDLDYPDELPIVMTEKDAVRCASFATSRMWFVPVETELEESDAAALLDHVAGLILAR